MAINAIENPALKSEAILVIEDERPTSHGLQAELSRRGFRADIAESVSAAADRLTGFAYTAVVLDLILPNDGPLDRALQPGTVASRFAGVEVLRRIRKGEFAGNGTVATVPVFVLTCVLDEETRKELDALKVQAFWSKPLGLSMVAERVKLFLHRSPKS